MVPSTKEDATDDDASKSDECGMLVAMDVVVKDDDSEDGLAGDRNDASAAVDEMLSTATDVVADDDESEDGLAREEANAAASVGELRGELAAADAKWAAGGGSTRSESASMTKADIVSRTRNPIWVQVGARDEGAF